MSFKSTSMQRIRVFAPANASAALVDALYSFGAIHITQAKSAVSKEKSIALPSFAQVSNALVTLRATEKILQLNSASTPSQHYSLNELLNKFNSLNCEKIINLNKEQTALKTKANEIQNKITLLTPFKSLKINPYSINPSKLIEFTYIELNTTAQTLENDLKKANISNEIYTVKNNKTEFALIAFDKRHEQNAKLIAQKHAKKTINIPTIESSTFSSEIHKLENELHEINYKIEEIQNQLTNFKEHHAKTIYETRNGLEFESKKAQLPFNFAASKSVIAVEGWIPTKIANELETNLNQKLSTSVYVELIHTNELAPTLLSNKPPASSFEELVKFFSLPKSTELDPSALVAISFPLFFGMIVGDIGYGIVSLLLAYYIYLKMGKTNQFMKALATMLAMSSIASIIFGIVFAEFFGFEHIFGYALHPLIHRLDPHGLDILMSLSILFGMLHLSLGFILGVKAAIEHAHYKHAIGKLAWFTLMWSLVLTITANMSISFFQLLTPAAHAIPAIAWTILLLISIIAIAITEGVTNLFEIPGILSNIFSYLRIMALGVSGVIIAYILNLVPAALNFSNPVSIAISILLMIVYVLGQIGGIVLALFESMVQSMRLQYVEFFSKFFEGGGFEFKPLDDQKVHVRKYK